MSRFKEILPQEVSRLSEEGGQIKLIDVRTPEEFTEIRSVLAQNLPLDQLSSEKVESLGLKKDDPIYMICRSGARSAKACEILADAGFTQLYNVTGGTLGWAEKGLPTAKGNY
ncbi:MAG: rhodanese-like domain-containing protein [Bdellovibrionota bacterium]